MNPDESRMYNLGRQAHEAGFQISACNISRFDTGRAWWVAGWHDRDMETSVTVAASKQRLSRPLRVSI